MFSSQKVSSWLEHFQETQPALYFVADLFVNIVVIIVLVFTIRTYLISPFQVFGPSMCDNLNYIEERCQEGFGEYLIVNKALYYPFFGNRFKTPQRGDIVVFHPPHNEEDFYIKRIIGLPGEEVKIQDGNVYITPAKHSSAVLLKEPYLNSDNRSQTYVIPAHLVKTYRVPEGTFFVLGDNRRKSTDSRTCFKGSSDRDCADQMNHFLPIVNIEGKASIVLWPFNKLRVLTNPEYGL